MSAKDLEKLRDEAAFEPMLRFDELPIDHVPYQELVGRDVEHDLVGAVVADTRCASVVAPSGAGKSSTGSAPPWTCANPGARIERSGVSAPLDDVLDGEALVRLEAEYERRDRDLRTTLQIAHTTLRLAGPSLPERLTVDDVRAAVAVLDG
jgi:hypothetical protein